jgi:hypothetical protein
MAECFSILLAADIVPLEVPDPNAVRSPGPDGQGLPALEAALMVAIVVVIAFAFSRRRQRRRKTHRPRNPTLAETGGLPPPRQS